MVLISNLIHWKGLICFLCLAWETGINLFHEFQCLKRFLSSFYSDKSALCQSFHKMFQNIKKKKQVNWNAYFKLNLTRSFNKTNIIVISKAKVVYYKHYTSTLFFRVIFTTLIMVSFKPLPRNILLVTQAITCCYTTVNPSNLIQVTNTGDKCVFFSF